MIGIGLFEICYESYTALIASTVANRDLNSAYRKFLIVLFVSFGSYYIYMPLIYHMASDT